MLHAILLRCHMLQCYVSGCHSAAVSLRTCHSDTLLRVVAVEFWCCGVIVLHVTATRVAVCCSDTVLRVTEFRAVVSRHMCQWYSVTATAVRCCML